MLKRPTTLLAELTYRCPLHCPYCSNPVQMTEPPVRYVGPAQVHFAQVGDPRQRLQVAVPQGLVAGERDLPDRARLGE